MKKIISSAFFASTLVASTYAMADDTTTTMPVQTAPTVGAPTSPSTTPLPANPSSSTTLTSSDPNDATVTPTPINTTPSTQESMTVYAKHTPNKALMFTGLGIFAGSYVTTAAITAGSPDTLDKSLYLPIVGPWLTLAQASDYGTGKTVLIAGSGILQGVGAGLAIASLFVPEKTAAATITAGPVKMNVLPASYGVGSAGVGAVGTF